MAPALSSAALSCRHSPIKPQAAADRLQMLAASPAILGLLLADMAALLVYNVAGMSVMGRLGAVFRCGRGRVGSGCSEHGWLLNSPWCQPGFCKEERAGE